MGFAIAETLAEQGADVVLIAGPTSLHANNANIQRIDVTSAEEMFQSAVENFPFCQGAVLSAAVADFTPVVVADRKVKRGKENFCIELRPTRDIAASLGKMKKPNQIMVGFALETYDEELNAKEKLKRKNLDFIVLNSLNDPGAGFQVDTNKITIIEPGNKISHFGLKTKKEVAEDIVNKIIEKVSTV